VESNRLFLVQWQPTVIFRVFTLTPRLKILYLAYGLMIWLSHTLCMAANMKTTLNLDDQVMKNAKARAARDGITFTALVEDAIRAKLLQDPHAIKYQFKPNIITGNKPPNVDISERDALYEVIDNS